MSAQKKTLQRGDGQDSLQQRSLNWTRTNMPVVWPVVTERISSDAGTAAQASSSQQNTTIGIGGLPIKTEDHSKVTPTQETTDGGKERPTIEIQDGSQEDEDRQAWGR